MLLDYQVDPSSRQCCQTGRRLAPGERYFSVLVAEGPRVVRRDYSREAWQGAEDSWLGWWEATVPDRSGSTRRPAPDEVLLNLLAHLADEPQETAFRYLLALLLVRRRIVRLAETTRDEQGREQIELICPARGEQYTVVVADPEASQVELLQQRLSDLLDAGDAETS